MSMAAFEGWIVLNLIKELKNFLNFDVSKTFENILAYYDSKVGTEGALLLTKGFFLQAQ